MTFNFPVLRYPSWIKNKKKTQITPLLAPKIGLVLSGGGARGLAHLGVLQAFDELEIPIHHISGVSAGALVGALYAAGNPPYEILKSLMKIRINRFFRPLIGQKGLLNLENIGKILRKYLQDDFQSLKIPLHVATTDLQNSQLVYFSNGPLIQPLLASCSIPVLFKPIKINNQLYVDGGVLNNFPIEPLQSTCHKIIGVHVNPFQEFREIKGIRSVVEHSFHLAVSLNVAERLKKCDLLIEPLELKKYRLNKISKAEEMFEIGYREAYPLLKKFKAQHAIISRVSK
jgi:NTE family protein